MLVVSRKIGETIKIGDDIEITIVKIENGTVKIAIDAPKKVTILRKELYKEVKEENINAVVFDKVALKNLKNKI